MVREFLVLRNADGESSLPFLLYLPIDGGIWLKAKESWPRSSRVYCHPCAVPSFSEGDVLERVPVLVCERRGPAIDLVLMRGVNKRSQFVSTTFRGRAMTFWQTPRSAAASRPGLRVPVVRARTDQTILVDSRERYGYTFRTSGVAIARRALPCGDYAIERDGGIAAAVERKASDDFVKCLVDGSLNFAMAELAALPAAAVVAETLYSKLLRHEYTRPGFIPELIARVQVRYPNVPIVFAESRKLGEEWTLRFLLAAHANAGALALSALPAESMQTAPPPKRRRRKRETPS